MNTRLEVSFVFVVSFFEACVPCEVVMFSVQMHAAQLLFNKTSKHFHYRGSFFFKIIFLHYYFSRV